MGEWLVPPHQYRMFVTALSEDGKNRSNEQEEKDSLPAFGLFSQNVKDSFFIFVHLPRKYERNKNERYNVVYLLDANVYFDQVAEYVERVSRGGSKNEPIIVGIGYRSFVEMDSLRNRDYTYPIAKTKFGFTISGGADKFYNFIEKELRPYMYKNYRADSSGNALMGHSLGGYFVLYALGRERSKPLFKYYISASPSILYNPEYLEDQLKTLDPNREGMLYLSIGGMEDKEEDDGDIKESVFFDTLTGRLLGLNSKDFKVEKEAFPVAGHMETAIPSFQKGLNITMEQDKR